MTLCQRRAMTGALVGAAVVSLATASGRAIDAHGAAACPMIDPLTSSDINWRLLPGVGPVLAHRLARCGDAGLLGEPADLTHVPGIGPSRAHGIACWISWPRVPRP